jgi:hypothetical protein
MDGMSESIIRAVAELRDGLERWGGYFAITELLQKHSEAQVFLAGGAVRNVFMGRGFSSKDLDFFVAGVSPKDLDDCFRNRGALVHNQYGSPRWTPANDARSADIIPIREFSPGLWPCADIVDVLAQFDFTANAVALDLRSNVVFDPQNGVRDAEGRVMKMVRFDFPSGPYVFGETLNRNAILWFRIIHYTSILSLSMEPRTREWIAMNRHFLSSLPEFSSRFFDPNVGALDDIVDAIYE